MADKRRPHLRDEVSASLAGLDDLAAELTDSEAPAQPTSASTEAATPAPVETPPAEAPAAPPRPATRHLDIGSMTEAAVIEPPAPPEAPAETHDEAAEPPAPPENVELDMELVEPTPPAPSAEPAESLTFETVSHDAAARISGGNAAAEAGAHGEEHSPTVTASIDVGDEAPSAIVETAPAVDATAAPRPWSPAAAMEPIPPLAPPPARPIATTTDTPAPRLPADGGKKMNILPVVMIGLFFLVVVALIVIVVHQT